MEQIRSIDTQLIIGVVLVILCLVGIYMLFSPKTGNNAMKLFHNSAVDGTNDEKYPLSSQQALSQYAKGLQTVAINEPGTLRTTNAAQATTDDHPFVASSATNVAPIIVKPVSTLNEKIVPSKLHNVQRRQWNDNQQTNSVNDNLVNTNSVGVNDNLVSQSGKQPPSQSTSDNISINSNNKREAKYPRGTVVPVRYSTSVPVSPQASDAAIIN